MKSVVSLTVMFMAILTSQNSFAQMMCTGLIQDSDFSLYYYSAIEPKLAKIENRTLYIDFPRAQLAADHNISLGGCSSDPVSCANQFYTYEYCTKNREIIEKIIKLWGDSYLGIDWNKVLDELNNTYLMINRDTIDLNTDGRRSGNFIRNASFEAGSGKHIPMVHLNLLDSLQASSEQRQLINLHEAIQAGGYKDPDYQYAIYLRQKVKQVNTPRADDLTLSDSSEHFQLALGGGTIVSGGGDLLEAHIKERMIQEIQNSKAWDVEIQKHCKRCSVDSKFKSKLATEILHAKIRFHYNSDEVKLESRQYLFNPGFNLDVYFSISYPGFSEQSAEIIFNALAASLVQVAVEAVR